MTNNPYKICENCGHPLLTHDISNFKNVRCTFPNCKCKRYICENLDTGKL